MFFCIILLFVTISSFLRSFHVSSCDNCTDIPVFTPSRLVVKFGDPASARCSICQQCQSGYFGLEKNVGDSAKNGTTMRWTVNGLTEWSPSVMCYYNDDDTGDQCCGTLHITVYKPPDNVSFSFVNHTGVMFEGRQYTLQCAVENVAPVKNLVVTFYRGQTALGHLQSNNNTEKEPVTEIFSLNVTPGKEDDGVQYWCKAHLEFGPEGPQLPPVVMSENITTTVYYKPQREGSSHLDPITITEGNPLQLNCSAVGNPSPSYTWTLPIGSPSPSEASVLTIKSVTAADGGQYTCSVSNDVGNVTVKFNVVVQGLELTSTRLPPSNPTTKQSTTVRSSSTSSTLIHRFLLCFVLLFSALV